MKLAVRVLLALGAMAATAALLVAIGRWEQRREVAHEVAGMEMVVAAVGPLDKAKPTGYRFGPPDCLAYSIPQNQLGLELCFDRTGRLVETADRRGVQPVYASLAYDPELSPIREPLPLVRRLLETTFKRSGGR